MTGYVRGRSAVGREKALIGALVAAIVFAVLGVATTFADVDHVPDLSTSARSIEHALSGLTWQLAACLTAVSVLHYFAATVAARVAAGVPMRLGELWTAQLAAATVNRVTPAGIGGATILSRYFCRRGRLSCVRSLAAVTALSVLGGLADAFAFATLIAAGVLFGVPGVSREVPLLASRFTGVVPLPSGTLGWLALAVGAFLLAGFALPQVRRGPRATRLHAGLRNYRDGLAGFLRCPGRMLALMLASAAATVSLSTGFAAAAVLGPAGSPASSFGALMTGYMVAAAAATALPTPGGIGTADAALTGVLLAAGSPAATALATVLAFRLVTFWAPAVIGLPLLRVLRQRGAL